MILASVNLLNNTADTGAIVTNDYEDVLSNKPHFLVRGHYFHMRKALLISANFVLAFYDKHTSIS